MPDLADRISHAAVAALDLAPFDDRFGRLSRQVLAGGATRFLRVTADDQTVHFVIPVGLVGQRIDYGALVLQDRQAGVLWRDAQGVDHAVVVPRSESSATFSPLELGGEDWLRFDVEGAGETLTFLAPPADGPLGRTLVDFFRAVPGQASGGSVPEPDPEPAPAVRFPDPEPEPEPVETTAVLSAVADGAADETTVLPVDEPVPAPEAETAVLPGGEPVQGPEAETTVLPVGEPVQAPPEPTLAAMVIPAGEPLAPQEQFAVPPADLNEWGPRSDANPLEETRVHSDGPHANPLEETRIPPTVPEAGETHIQAPFDLYRDQQPTPQQAAPPWASASTQQALAQQPPLYQQATYGQWDQSPAGATGGPVEAAPVHAQASGTSRTLVGFLLGLFGTLAVGGAVIIAQLIG